MPHFGPVRTVWDFPGGISRFASSICPHPQCVLTAESAFAACAALRSAGKCRVFRRSAHRNGHQAEIGFTGAVNWGSSDRCIECGQCSLVCPTGAISVRDQGCDVFDMLDDDSITTVFQFAPALRVALSEEFGLPPGMDVQGKIVSALKRMGADYVMDTNWSADVTIMEEGTEMLANFERAKKAGTLHSKPFTYFTSCCPGWVNYVEKIAPDMIPHVSSTRSPQAIFGALAKTWLVEHAGIEKRDMRVISIMPCTAKKGEANRDTLKRADGSCDVDVVLTIREFARLIKRSGLNLADLPDMPFDSPMMSLSSGAGQLFGSTGGVMEAAVRTMSAVKNQDPRPMPAASRRVRGMEFIKERRFVSATSATFALQWFTNVPILPRSLKWSATERAPYHFVEVMACPGGCVGGGGTTRGVWGRNTAKRQQGIYAIDKVKKIRASYENPEVIRLYQEYLGSPGSERAHELLHCEYKPWKKRERKLTGPEILESVELSPE